MDYRLFIFFITLFPFGLNAQESLKDKLKRKIAEAKERTTDNTIDKILKKGENKVDETINDAMDSGKKKPKESNAENTLDNESSKRAGSIISPVFSVSSKFDFIPGEKVTASEDFVQDAVGDFPAKWNTNANGEVVNLGFSGMERWLQVQKVGIYYPEFVNSLPENFTVEFDMAISDEMSEMQAGLKIYFPLLKQRNLQFDQYFNTTPNVGFDLHPVPSGGGYSSIWVFDQSGKTMENTTAITWNVGKANHIAIWRQKSRVRLYINQQKVWDIPKAFVAGLEYSLLFATNIWTGNAYISNLRVAQGLPDTRNKLVAEGKFTTNGILFDVNSDQMQPSSAGVLKEIATVLNENPALKIKIIGHTDADGQAEANLQLSKRRAVTVKTILAGSYGVDAARMETDGKGDAQPIDSNQTSQGKANNRRVEFIKM